MEELGIKSMPDFDTFLSEQKYLKCVEKMTNALYDLRALMVDLWGEATFLEEARINGIHSLYQELVNNNQAVYGQDVVKQLINLKETFKKNEQFMPLALMGNTEIQAFHALCISFNKQIDLNKNNTLEV